MTHHTASHESVTPCVHSLSGIFTRLLWTPSPVAQWAPWCELTTSGMEPDLRSSSDGSHLSFLSRNFRKYLKCNSGLLLQDSMQTDAQPTYFTSPFYLLSKRMHSPAFLHTPSFALWALRVALYHAIFLIPLFTRAGFYCQQLAHGVAPALNMLGTEIRIQFLVFLSQVPSKQAAFWAQQNKRVGPAGNATQLTLVSLSLVIRSLGAVSTW